jgi:SAM-dependent methyltransferase
MRKQKAKGFQFDIASVDHTPSSGESGTVDSQNKTKTFNHAEQAKNRASDSRASSSLQQTFKERLSGSRFRVLNEELYTTPSSAAYRRFSTHPELYHQYHEGFRHQVGRWPVNPVNVIASTLKARAMKGQPPGSAQHSPLVVADFGCGDAELARQLLALRQRGGRSVFLVHSFDLVASCDLVTACDMARVPLNAGTVDVGVFCLSLMGTNLADFIREAHRVLKEDGGLVIAEVRSRFESKNGRDEFSDFLGVLSKLGFECSKEDRTNKMFLLLEFKKTGVKPDGSVSFTAKPCIYKRR